jgi:hypothetical protein
MSYLARGQKRPVRVSDDPDTTLLGIKTLLIHCTVRTYEKWKRKLPKDICAADFSLLNLPKGKSLGRSKPAISSYAQAPHWDDSYYIQALLNCLL